MKLILLVIGMVLLSGNISADIGYSEINLIDYDTNKFIHVNSSIPLTNYTFEIKSGKNWIGMPFGAAIDDADGLIRSIPNMSTGNNVKWWNSTSQSIMVYTYLAPNFYMGFNFPVESYRGYEIVISTDAIWSIECLQPVNPILQYQCFDLNKYIGTNIIRVRNI